MAVAEADGGEEEYPEGGASAVTVRGLRKRFGYRDVLRGVELSVERGSCLALFGPNGAGKSTLVRILATQWRPSEGDGTILGWDLRRQTQQIRRRIGVVFHQSFLRSELTLEENLRFYRDLYSVSGTERAGELLETFGLAHRLRDRVSTFSQGMQKRANLIRSLLHHPDLWILDEPFSGLDPEGRDLLAQMVRDFVDGGRSVVLVTHNTRLGRELASHTITLVDGEVVESAAETEGGP